MKLKSKLILAASTFLILSGGAAATSTFAWYTAVRQVSLAVNTVNVSAMGGDLSVALHDATTNTVTGTTAGNGVSLSSAYILTDASGDGDGTFIKPMFDASGSDASGNVVGWWTESNYKTEYASQIWYHEFTLDFSVTGDQTMALYLSRNSSVTGTLADQVRFSAVGSSSSELFYANPTGTELSYWIAGTPAPTTGSVTAADNTGAGIGLTTSNFFTNPSSEYNEGDVSFGGSGTYTYPYYGFIGDVSSGASVSVTFYVWIEGTDPDTLASSLTNFAGTFDLNLGFFTLIEE